MGFERIHRDVMTIVVNLAMKGDSKVTNLNRSSRLRAGYVCFGRKTFDLEQANALGASTVKALGQFDVSWRMVEGLVTTLDRATAEAQRLAADIDILVAQFTTFVDARFIVAMAEKLRVPVIAWAIREPNQSPGQRLSLNSLTGANLAGRELHQLGIPFQFLYGSVDDADFSAKLEDSLRFWSAWRKLNGFTVVTVGEAPDGFFFSMPGDKAVKELGINVLQVNLNETFARALALTDDEIKPEIARIQGRVKGLERLPQDNVAKFAKMLTVLKADLAQLHADAVAIRCWPEFFTDFGAAACSAISALSDAGIMGACEADVLGALSMDVLYQLTGSPAYLGDLVEINEEKQAVVFWHCGAGAFSLARSDAGAVAGRHPNRNVGFTLEFGLKPGIVTILRIGEDRDGTVRALVGKGEVLNEPARFRGTSGVVRLLGDGDVTQRVTGVIEAGFEPHYALAYGDAIRALERLFQRKGIPVTKF